MKIIYGVSHLDHGLKSEHVDWLMSRFADRSGFFVETVELPSGLPPLRCSLYGPAMGDAPVTEDSVSYGVRPGRRCATRFVSREPRETRLLTVIAGGVGEDPCVLYTSYGGPEAPREPGDPTLGTMAQITESREFWAKHALSLL